MDWSWKTLKSDVGGLLSDPQKQQALLANPMFNMGMGLLAQNAMPGGGNPAAGLLGGLTASKQQDVEEDERKRIEQARREIADYFRMMQNGGLQPGGGMVPMNGQMVPAQGSVAAASQQLPGSQVSGIPPAVQAMQWKMIMDGMQK